MTEQLSAKGMLGDRYELREIIGRGGMGLVYRAYDRQVGRDIALKTIIDIQGNGALEQFYKERQVLASLHHPNLIEIFDFGYFQEHGVMKPFIAMPLLSGMTLGQMMRAGEPAAGIPQLVGIFQQICFGLEALHAIGFVHRDIKPSNIFLMSCGAVKVIDFGVAHLVGAQTITGLKGTPSYMAPEQIRGEECKPVSDIFSLGVLFYQALTGVHPFHGGSPGEIMSAVLCRVPRPVYELNSSVCPALAKVIHKALAKNPSHRISSVAEFREWLQMAVRGENPAMLDTAQIQPRVQRVLRALEVGNLSIAKDILSELDDSGDVDPSLADLRRRIEEANRSNTLAGLLERASMQLAEEECLLALQTIESILKLDAGNQAAAELRAQIHQRIASRAVEGCLQSAQEKAGQGDFTGAREYLKKAHELSPGDPRPLQVLLEINQKEDACLAAQRAREESSQAAMKAWDHGEFRAAAKALNQVVELEPDPKRAAYSRGLLEKVQAGVSAIEDFETQLTHSVSEKNYDQAVRLCTEHARNYPGHPVIEGMRQAVEALRQQETLERISQLASRAVAEPDLAARVSVVLEGLHSVPEIQSLLHPWISALEDQLAHVNKLVSRARAHEESKQFPEALDCWHMVRTIHPQFAGVDREVARLQCPPEESREPAVPKVEGQQLIAASHSSQASPWRVATLRAWFRRTWSAFLAAKPRYRVFWPPKARLVAFLLCVLLIGKSEIDPARSRTPSLRMPVAAPSVPETNRTLPSDNTPMDSGPQGVVPGQTTSAARDLPPVAGDSSGRNTGALWVYTGLRVFQAALDDQSFNGVIRNGAMLIPNLPAKRYRLRVTASGYETKELEITVVKGARVKEKLELSEAPVFGTLQIRDAPPRSQVLIDGEAVGTAGADGALSYERVTPGSHRIELRNSPRYQSKTFQEMFKSGDAIVLAADWTSLQKAPSTVTVNVTPPNARLRWQCGQNPARTKEGVLSDECAEDQLSVTAELPGYETASKTWPLAAGEALSFNMVLARVADSSLQGAVCNPTDLARSGWTRDGDWWLAPQSVKIPCTGLTGQFQFTIQVPRKAVLWSWKSGPHDLTVQLDKRTISVSGLAKKEISEYAEGGALKFRIVVEPAGVTAFVWTHNSWVQIGSLAGDTRNGQLVFAKNIKMKEFTHSGVDPQHPRG